jgi:hypothetical protein
MAERWLPSWKQVYDTVEKSIGPRIDEFARSEEFAALAALNKRSQTEFARRLEQVSRRTLHVLNLPAGSDVNRLLTHIAQLEREVRDLRKQVTDRSDSEFLESLATRRAAMATAPTTVTKTKAGSSNSSGTKRATVGQKTAVGKATAVGKTTAEARTASAAKPRKRT